MSEYKAPQPEMHVPIEDLDLSPEKPVWYVFKRCAKCEDELISMPPGLDPDAWPDYCRGCTEYYDCECGHYDISYLGWKPYPVRHSYRDCKMPANIYGLDGTAFTCEC